MRSLTLFVHFYHDFDNKIQYIQIMRDIFRIYLIDLSVKNRSIYFSLLYRFIYHYDEYLFSTISSSLCKCTKLTGKMREKCSNFFSFIKLNKQSILFQIQQYNNLILFANSQDLTHATQIFFVLAK